MVSVGFRLVIVKKYVTVVIRGPLLVMVQTFVDRTVDVAYVDTDG